MNGGILLARQGAWFAAALSFGAHIGLLLLLQFGVFSPPEGLSYLALGWVNLYQAIFTHGAAFGLTAVVASYVAAQLERADSRADVAEDQSQQIGCAARRDRPLDLFGNRHDG